MLLELAASASASTSGYVEAAAFATFMGAAMVAAGRLQRPTGRHFLAPDNPVRIGDNLVDAAPVRRRHRTAGRVYEVLGWILLAGGAIQTVMAVRSALR